MPKDEVRKELTDNFMNPSDMNIELNSFVVKYAAAEASERAREPKWVSLGDCC